MYLGATSPNVKKRQAIEKRIVLSLIDELLAARSVGAQQLFMLSVDDGGDDETPATRDREAIVKAIMETDEDYLHVWFNGRRFGWVRLVYGNDGWDVICDYTVNLEPVMAQTIALAKQLED